MNNQQFIKENAPCYIYDKKLINEQCRKLKSTLSAFHILYSIKANPFDRVIQCITDQGFGADAASANEVLIAARNGLQPEQIFYSAPGKTENDLVLCYGKCIMIADSFTEIERMNAQAMHNKDVLKIGVRINPSFSMGNGPGAASKFGIDEEQMGELQQLLRKCQYLQIVGIHIHIKSQILDYKTLEAYYHNCFRLAQKMGSLENVKMEFINFGSGIGTIYDTAQDQPVNLEKLADVVSKIVNENCAGLNAKLYIETGRFVVCNAGTYYTKIIDIKFSHGKKFLIVQNGLNGFMRPAIANLLHKVTGEIEIPEQEPFYTCRHEFALNVLNHANSQEPVTVAGSLCTALDILGEDVELNVAQIGDVIAVSNAGSYACTLSPLLFSSHAAPKEFLQAENGAML
ncbi:hypothetical protein [Oscillibacter sp.]|uniref:diaminopimelate decarboxylase family protein n=1 Tax=Oscillibacter sp. TaxID=1945593 RepID=UPI003398BD7C